jgi:4-hydroxybenzoate polyprenyltransferase
VSLPRALVAGARPAHAWKSVPVLVPVVAGHRATEPDALARAALAAVAFALVASTGYLVNDVVDAPADRRDPRRAGRPVASGALPPRTALVGAAALAAIGLVPAAAWLPAAAAPGLGAYLALSLAYTAALKRVRVLAPLVVAAGFVLRVLVGSWAVPVAPSPWLVGLAGTLALALAVAKRESDARAEAGEAPRRLRLATDVLLVASFSGYVAYAAWPSTVALHGTRALVATALPVALALARFRSRLRRSVPPAGPAEIVARDPVLLGLGAVWLAAYAALVLL